MADPVLTAAGLPGVVPSLPEPVPVFVVERPYLIQDGRNPAKDVALVGDDVVEVMAVDMASGGSTHKFTVAHAFPMLTKVEAVFNASLHRLLGQFVLGYNATALCVGASDHGKTELFGGGPSVGGPELNNDPSAQKGLVGLGLADLWDLLDSTAAQCKQANRQFKYTLQVSCFEVYDEKVRDLLSDAAVDLPVVNDPEVGYCVAGLAQLPVSSAAAAEELFARSKLKRQANMGDYDTVPPSHDATFFMQLQLEQHVERPASGAGFGGGMGLRKETVRSRFLFCELAGTEALAQQRRQTIATQRKKTLAQGVLSVKAVADQVGKGPARNGGTTGVAGAARASQALVVAAGGAKEAGAGPTRQWESDFANFPQSVVTKLLQQTLGGNCLASCVASIMQGGADGTVATMEMLDSLSHVQCAPVPFSARTAMLLRRLRVNILRLQDQLDAFRLLGSGGGKDGAGGGSGDGDKAGSEMQVAKMREKTLELQIKLKELQHSRDAVQHELDVMRLQYEKLVEKKSHMQADFIQTEEEKLRVSKALLDLQIENNQLKERLDRGQYDVDSKMLTLEHELIEMQVERDALHEKHTQLEADLKEAAVELRDLQEEYITLRTNYISLTKEFNDSKQKNENINAEFLTLVNKASLLEDKNRELTLARDDLARDAEASKRTASMLEIENAKAVDEARELRAAVIQLEAQKLNLEAQLRAQNVEHDEQRLRLEQDAVGQSLAREGEMLSRQRGLQNEQSRFTTENSMLQQTLEQTQTQLRASERKRRAAVQAADDAVAECNRWKVKYRDTEAALTDKTAAYQRQLVTYVIGNDTENQWFQEIGQHLFTTEGKEQLVRDSAGRLKAPDAGAPRPVDPADNDEASIPGRAVHEMVSVHDATIRHMVAKVQRAEASAEDARRNAQAIRTAYTELYEQMQDLGPNAGLQVPPLEETLRATATEEARPADAEGPEEKEARIQQLTRQLESECQTRVHEAAKFVHDRSKLNEQIRLLEAKLEAGGGNGSKDGDNNGGGKVAEEQVNKLVALQQELLKKLDELQANGGGQRSKKKANKKKKKTKKKGGGDDADEAGVADDDGAAAAAAAKAAEAVKAKDAQIAKLKKRIAKLKKDLATERKKKKQPTPAPKSVGGGKKGAEKGGGGGGGGDNSIPGHDEWKSKCEGLQAKLTALQAEYDTLLDRLENGLTETGKEDLSKTLRSAESRAAQGMTKYTMAEAELKNYKDFMNKTIKSYNKKIAELKKKVSK